MRMPPRRGNLLCSCLRTSNVLAGRTVIFLLSVSLREYRYFAQFWHFALFHLGTVGIGDPYMIFGLRGTSAIVLSKRLWL